MWMAELYPCRMTADSIEALQRQLEDPLSRDVLILQFVVYFDRLVERERHLLGCRRGAEDALQELARTMPKALRWRAQDKKMPWPFERRRYYSENAIDRLRGRVFCGDDGRPWPEAQARAARLIKAWDAWALRVQALRLELKTAERHEELARVSEDLWAVADAMLPVQPTSAEAFAVKHSIYTWAQRHFRDHADPWQLQLVERYYFRDAEHQRKLERKMLTEGAQARAEEIERRLEAGDLYPGERKRDLKAELLALREIAPRLSADQS